MIDNDEVGLNNSQKIHNCFIWNCTFRNEQGRYSLRERGRKCPSSGDQPFYAMITWTNNPILYNSTTKVLSVMFRTLLVLKLLKCPTPDGGHLGFVKYGRHRGSPSWLPREIGRRWLYLPLVQKWCLWNDLNNYLIKPPD